MKLTQYFNNFLTLLKIGESGGSMLFSGSPVAPAVAGGFVSKLYFCDDVIFPATNPVWCELESNPDGTFVANHTLVSSALYQMFSTHGYVTGPLGITALPGGEWSLDIYSAIASGSGQIQVNLYKVAADGSHGAPFATFETAVFNNTALAINRATKFVNSQAGWLATDRVGITILGRKIIGGGTPTMTFSHDKIGGTMSTVTSPISLLHDQMFGLNAGNYQHLTLVEKAAIETLGDFVPKTRTINGLDLSADRIIESVSLASTTPVIEGTAAVGIASTAARADHIHPATLFKTAEGALSAQLPDSQIAGGNVRGVGAADFQVLRTDKLNVASGIYSFVFGRNCRASGTYSVAGGLSSLASGAYAIAIGNQCTASASGAVALGDYANATTGADAIAIGGYSVSSNTQSVALGRASDASGTYTTALGPSASAAGAQATAVGRSASAAGIDATAVGFGANASATSSVALGKSAAASGISSIALGNGAAASGQYSTAIGAGATTRTAIYGKYCYSHLQINAAGDNQCGKILLNVTTTNASSAVLVSSSGAPTVLNQLCVPVNATFAFSILVSARRNSAQADESAGWKIEGLIKNVAGTVSFVGTPTKTVLGKDTAATAWDCNIYADSTLDCLSVSVTGDAAKSIRWIANVDTTELVY